MATQSGHQDARVNPYRYGVLEGNHVEDRYGLDLVHKEVKNIILKKIDFYLRMSTSCLIPL